MIVSAIVVEYILTHYPKRGYMPFPGTVLAYSAQTLRDTLGKKVRIRRSTLGGCGTKHRFDLGELFHEFSDYTPGEAQMLIPL